MAKLYFRHGAVGSAKTLNLLAVAHSYEFQGKKVVIAKPSVDVRFGAAEVKSRANLSKEADLVIATDTDLTVELARFGRVNCLVVDEAQFLSTAQIDMLRSIADRGVPVICYGLRTDFRSQLFEGSKRLMEIADSIDEVKTTCYYCDKKAVLNLKLVDGKGTLSGAQVDLGCEEKYLPVCAKHFGAHTHDCEGAEEFYRAGVYTAKLATAAADGAAESALDVTVSNSSGLSSGASSVMSTPERTLKAADCQVSGSKAECPAVPAL